MLPAISIVGRPNVGKSTLFNQLTRSRNALVADQPGLTRDRQYGLAQHGSLRCIVVDTGGFSEDADDITVLTVEQALVAEREADLIVFVVDGFDGVTAADEIVAARLRRYGKPLIVVVNKTDRIDQHIAGADFHGLGLGDPQPIAAVHGRGINALWDRIGDTLPAVEPFDERVHEGVKVAIIGRPNVGKSTFVNALLGEDRVIAHDMPGTTRDSVYIPYQRRGHDYTIIDTAGVRRRSKVDERIEKYSIIKTLQALEACNVAVVLVDARDAITEQDTRLLGMVLDSGRGVVIGVNKWDAIDEEERKRVKASLDRKLRFIAFARLHFISALESWGMDRVMTAVDRSWEAATRDLSTPVLTRVLAAAVERHAPPLVSGRRIKLRYAHQGGSNPPVIVIHGNQTKSLPEAYRRYLVGIFRSQLKLQGTPVRIELKAGKNPYEGRKNVLTDRQKNRRKRMIRHVRR